MIHAVTPGTALTYTVAVPPAWWRRKYYRSHGFGKRGRPSANHGQFKPPVDCLDRPGADPPHLEANHRVSGRG